ncbi:Clavaminate synthase-like protein [Westerdykella ornata]|uniref:Clavaminate synthase-like protein n=1 Tax=Westerdykella ornata TaxID=318751 RepID=A0A6A6JMF5_WESOR|nr:Clavaminate synthase-like protein [Westerdykella ornata]KAF2277771.1 Clavaminate synthase-like protein [Westerdykella ornata]
MANTTLTLPILDLALADDPLQKPHLLVQLHDALFNIGFLYIKNHGVPDYIITNLVSMLPKLFDMPLKEKAALSKLNSPHFLGYSGYAEEVTLGQKDLREQFDFATELPVIWNPDGHTSQDCSELEAVRNKDFSRLYWRLRGPNQWPPESYVPGFRKALTEYHDALQELSYRFVHLIEEAFGIPTRTFDAFFNRDDTQFHVPPQHRIKLVKYPPCSRTDGIAHAQGVGAHKDSSGWLTFLLQVEQQEGLEVLSGTGKWIKAPPIPGTFVVNFGNAMEAATEGAVKATVHRVKARTSESSPRYSIPFFQGLPLDLTVSQIRSYIPEHVRSLRQSALNAESEKISSFLDPRWDTLGESQLRKWIRSHEEVGRKFYGDEVVDFYLN